MASNLLVEDPAPSLRTEDVADANERVDFPFLGFHERVAPHPRRHGERPDVHRISDHERRVGRTGGLSFEPFSEPADPARQTSSRQADLIAEARTSAAVAELLRITPEAVQVLFEEGVLYAVTREGGRVFPAFQFSHFGILPGARSVWPVVPRDLALIAVARWFCEPHLDLGVGDHTIAPRTWLLEGGDPERVVELARHL